MITRLRQMLCAVLLVVLAFVLAAEQLAVAKDCVLLVEKPMELVPANATVFGGEVLTARIEVFAKLGSWRVIVDAHQGDTRGFVRIDSNAWIVAENERRVLEVNVRVNDTVKPGLYNVRFVLSGQAIGPCDFIDSATEVFGVDVRVKGVEDLEVSDPANDFIDAATGQTVAPDGSASADIRTLSVRRTEQTLLFAVETEGRLPDVVADAAQRIGCYLDVDGNGVLGADLQPRGFEFLLLASWHPQDPFARLIDLATGQTKEGLTVSVSLHSLFLKVDLASLGFPGALHWACFSELTRGADRFVDTVAGVI